jgi:hypothetical protein
VTLLLLVTHALAAAAGYAWAMARRPATPPDDDPADYWKRGDGPPEYTP